MTPTATTVARHRVEISEDDLYAKDFDLLRERGQQRGTGKHRRPTGDTGQMQAVTEGRAA